MLDIQRIHSADESKMASSTGQKKGILLRINYGLTAANAVQLDLMKIDHYIAEVLNVKSEEWACFFL